MPVSESWSRAGGGAHLSGSGSRRRLPRSSLRGSSPESARRASCPRWGRLRLTGRCLPLADHDTLGTWTHPAPNRE